MINFNIAVLTLFSLFIYAIQSNPLSRQLQSSPCPSLSFAESYKATYQQASFSIKPTFTLACSNGTTYQVTNLQILNFGQALSYNSVQQSINVQDWSPISDNSFYNLTVTASFTGRVNGIDQTLLYQDTFILVIGKVDIQFRQYGSLEFQYDENVVIDFSTAFDPEQSKTGSLQVNWQCQSNFASCSDLGKVNSISGLTRLLKHKMVFGKQYFFNVTLLNSNSKYFKSSTAQIILYPIPPEQSKNPTECVDFNIQFYSSSYPANKITQFYTEVQYDSLNQTDVRIVTPYQGLTRCTYDYLNSNKVALMSVSMDNSALFSIQQALIFDGKTELMISQSALQNAFKLNNQYIVKFYAIITDNSGNTIIGYTYQFLVLSMTFQTLYASLSQTSIVVAKDKILYLDGSNSFDSRNFNSLNATFIWKLQNFPSIAFENTKILTLVPDNRTSLGINQPGLYYNYSLQIKDSTRISDAVYVNVQIAPDIDPSNCVTVSLKDINVDQIVTYSWYPLLLQAKVPKTSCQNVVQQSIYWECTSITWQFFEYFGNNYTIGIDRDNLIKLPKSKNINMKITVLYQVGTISYMAKKEFTLFVAKQELIPILKYSSVLNVNQSDLWLDASQSYDPEAVALGTTDAPVVCQWTCPEALYSLCVQLSGCKQTFSGSAIMQLSNYQSQIQNQMLKFQLSLTKDTRQLIQYIFVTIVDSPLYPNASISISQDFSLNNYTVLNALLLNQNANVNNVTYHWQFFKWNSVQYIQKMDNLINYESTMRIPPYYLSDQSEFMIVLTVTNNSYSTTIGLYKKINDVSYFTQGTFQIPFNSFTSYISTFQMTPLAWDASTSYSLFYQYRIKETENNYRVILSSTQADSHTPISIILPPITYENVLYIDVLDTDGNYMTMSQTLYSKPDQYLIPQSMAVKINTIITSAQNIFNENDAEQNFYKLQQYFSAYAKGYIDFQNYPSSYFKTLSEITVKYFNSTFMIDKRLNDVVSPDRKRIIKQHAIEALYFITSKHRDTTYNKDIVNMLAFLTNDAFYYLGTSFLDTASKAIATIFQTMDTQQGNNQDALVKNILTQINNFLISGESQAIKNMGLEFRFMKVKSTDKSISIMNDLQVDQSVILSKIQNQGFIMVAMNSTFLDIEVYDINMNLQIIQNLLIPVNITYSIDPTLQYKVLAGLISFYCTSRERLQDSWSKQSIKMIVNDTVNGIVKCQANHFSQYALVSVDYVIAVEPQNPIDPSMDPLNPNKTAEQKSEGKLVNDTQSVNKPIYINVVIDEKTSTLLPIGEIVAIALFVASTFYFYKRYKNDKNQQKTSIDNSSSNMQQSSIISSDKNTSFLVKRLQLFKIVFKQFNPYMNIFCINNKFLPRWVRNTVIQVYFMMISMYYMVIFVIMSNLMTNTNGSNNQGSYVGFFILSIIGISFGRPLCISIYYKFLYEADNKVEDYEIESKRSQFTVEDNKKQKICGEFCDQIDRQSNGGDIEKNIHKSEEKHYGTQNNVEKRFNSTLQQQNSRNEVPGRSSHAKITLPRLQLSSQKKAFQSNKKNKDKQLLKNEEYKENTEGSEGGKISTYEDLRNQSVSQNRTLINDESLQIISNTFLDGLGTVQTPKKQKVSEYMDDYQMEGGDKENSNNKLPPISFARNMQMAQQVAIDFHEGVLNRNDSDEEEEQVQRENNGPQRDQHQPYVVEQQQEFRVQIEADMNNYQQSQQQSQDKFEYNNENSQFDEAECKLEEIYEVPQITNINRDKTEREFIMFSEEARKSIERRTEDSPEQDDELNGESHIHSDDKQLYINKIIGKALIGVIWSTLIISHFIGLRLIKPSLLHYWAILSVVTYLVMLFVIDPILYVILSITMIPRDSKRKYEFYLRRHKRATFKSIFVWVFIGKEKMRDLKRTLLNQ